MGLALAPEESPDSTDNWLGLERAFGDYTLQRQVGSGGMGIVFEATRRCDGRKVALKLLRDLYAASPSQLRRFGLEAEAVARLDHPNIVRIHEVGEWDGHPFLCMEFIEGPSLNEIHRRKQSASETASLSSSEFSEQARLARFMAKTARAVEHAHARGVLHRDLKPGNILVDADGEPRLTDFGLAKLLAPSLEEARSTLTATGDAPGTPGFMSPEQVKHTALSEATDIYGLGAVLYACLTGRPPFHGGTPHEVFHHIVALMPTRPRKFQPAVHHDLETICLKCLEKNPGHRYATAGDLARDLERFASRQPISARRAGPLRRSQRWVRRNPVGTTLIVTLGLGLVVSLALLKVVNDQRREIALDRDQTFDEGMQKVSQIWREPGTEAVTISARELAILAGRSPAIVWGAQHVLTLAVRADDGPSSMAQRYARLLASYQERIRLDGGPTMTFQLQLLKPHSAKPNSLLQRDADLTVLAASDYYRMPATATGNDIIGVDGTSREGVFFARSNSGIADLRALAARTLVLPDPSLSLTLMAKARLVGEGLKASDLKRLTTILDQGFDLGEVGPVLSASETIARVLRGEADAGVCQRSQFERQRHRGLVELDKFPESPRLLVVRRGLDQAVVGALRRALAAPELKRWWPDNSFLPAPLDGTVASITNDSRLEAVRAAVSKAESFEAVHP